MFLEGEVPVTVGSNNSNGGLMNGDGIWAIILFAMIFGYGRNGFGGFGGGYGGGVGENYVLATDFATIERKLDGVNNGLCDGFYAQNTNMLTGFSNLQNTLCQGFNGVNTAILQSANATERGFATTSFNLQNGINDVSRQLSDCCCKLGRGLDNINFNMANNTCAITNAINNSSRDIIDNQNANYRALHEEIVANKIEAKNERIAELQDKLYRADLRASQAQQSNYITDTIINKLSPCPSPSYIVPNPNCCYDYTVTRNNGCCGGAF